MKKIKIAIVGFGNIGKKAFEAAINEPDMELVGIVRREGKGSYQGVAVVDSIDKLGDVDVAILATPSREVENYAIPILERGINTVDSFDIHNKIVELRKTLNIAAQKGNSVSIISAGWDPGSDSIIRALLLACAPKGITNTNFGPGMSMGHSVAAKAIKGVKDAMSVTLPAGSGEHKRVVYVELEQGADFNEIKKAIKADDYFAHDDTVVKQVDDDINVLKNTAHGVNLERIGVSGSTNNQRFNFSMTIDNPALTSQMMISSARATTRLKSGCYTLIEVPVIEFLAGDKEKNIKSLV